MPSREKTKELSRKMTEGLQKELDGLVSPISVRSERQGETKERRVVVGDETVFQKSAEDEQVSENKQEEEKVRPARKQVNPWGIVIGETD